MSLFRGGVLHSPIRGGLLIPLFPPDSILNLCVFPSHREGLGMGIQNGMGVWGKGPRSNSPMVRS